MAVDSPYNSQLFISFKASPNTLKIFDRGRGLLFKDFRDLIESPGFVALVKSLSRSALVLSLVERVSRSGNVAVTKVLSRGKQQETTVVSDLHLAMVSFDFCSGK